MNSSGGEEFLNELTTVSRTFGGMSVGSNPFSLIIGVLQPGTLLSQYVSADSSSKTIIKSCIAPWKTTKRKLRKLMAIYGLTVGKAMKIIIYLHYRFFKIIKIAKLTAGIQSNV